MLISVTVRCIVGVPPPCRCAATETVAVPPTIFSVQQLRARRHAPVGGVVPAGIGVTPPVVLVDAVEACLAQVVGLKGLEKRLPTGDEGIVNIEVVGLGVGVLLHERGQQGCLACLHLT